MPACATEETIADPASMRNLILPVPDTDFRVFHEKKRSSTEKVLSLSDGSAAYIKKGSRHPVIGYKPQLVRSESGFVTSLLVPQGNAADSIKLVPAIGASIKRTGVVAELVSTDDGYASANGWSPISAPIATLNREL